jgi:hypothetical protein
MTHTGLLIATITFIGTVALYHLFRLQISGFE